MPAAWVRVSPIILSGLSKTTWRRKSGHMLMAVAAKKHLTVFYRKREAPGAGRPEVKAAFTAAAAKTRGIARRSERNAIIREEMLRARVGTGVYQRRSRSLYEPLAGTVYKVQVQYTPGVKVKPPTSFVGK
ncbi:MAG: hypothetical protein KIH04_09005 [Candidatus Freyarchaeota archaeon]|nr:hypothetical protein [Candidatus Jordarchaeia archaeon]